MDEQRSSRTSTWLARLRLVITAGVLLGFVAGTLAVLFRTRRIRSDVDAIVRTDIPSVQELSSASEQLHRLDRLLEQYVRDAEVGSARPAVEQLRRCEGLLDATLGEYASRPLPSAEHAKYDEVTAQAAQLRRAIGAALSAADVEDWRAAEARLGEEQDASDRADAALEQLVSLDAAQGERAGIDASNASRSTVSTMAELTGAVSTLSVVAALLATASLRRRLSQLQTASTEAVQRAVGLQQRSEELEQFAGRVAHDVLSPLTAVGLGLEIAQRRLRADQAAERTVERALRSLARVRRTVDDLLEFARAGAHPAPDARADLRQAIQGVVEDVRTEAEAFGVAVVVEPFDTCWLACSAGVLISVVANLVRNAVRHIDGAPVRQVTLRVRAAGERARVEVQDTGPGIEERLQSSVFEPFVRADSSSTGSGLGLATVKKLVIAHGGRLGLESRPGRGSTFWFELPRREEAAE